VLLGVGGSCLRAAKQRGSGERNLGCYRRYLTTSWLGSAPESLLPPPEPPSMRVVGEAECRAFLLLAGTDVATHATARGVLDYSASAICTAVSAAPSVNWSPTNQKVRPGSNTRPMRMRPTATASRPAQSTGIG